ncbi:hypothetical protein C7S14_1380 [Burkholderia cepacia]|nr:hypothetical protein C7S14_1380 [Burkholderia cepacia]
MRRVSGVPGARMPGARMPGARTPGFTKRAAANGRPFSFSRSHGC